jgi:Flp pilus assembly protein TadG
MRIARRNGGTAPRRGAAMAEMAILLPFVVFLFLVALDFCRVFYCTQTLQGCAQAGAFYASGHAKRYPAASRELAAKQAALAEATLLDPPLREQDVAVTFSTTSATVTVTYDFRTITGFPGLPRSVRVVKAVEMGLAPTPSGKR